jgi:diguanylate cyclase (GGDEF)-like protein/PAS domain S-box-containing protein
MRAPTETGDAGWLQLSTYPLRNAKGAPAGAIEHVRDVTNLKKLEEQLREETVRHHILFEESPVGVVILAVDGAVVDANEQFAHMLGYTVDQVMQLHLWDWDTRADRERLRHTLEAAKVVQERFDATYRCKDGSLVQMEVQSTGAVIGERALVFLLCRDVTEKKAMQTQVRDMDVRDPLTGVYTGRHIFERLAENSSEYLRGRGDFSVSVLGVDRFKDLTDFHGSKAGDGALRELAQTIGSVIRPYDLLGRYGSGEFVLILRNAASADIDAMLERIMEMVRGITFTLEGNKMRFTLSCGVARSSEFARDRFSSDAMVSLAEQRLNEARVAGGDRYVGSPLESPVSETVQP